MLILHLIEGQIRGFILHYLDYRFDPDRVETEEHDPLQENNLESL